MTVIDVQRGIPRPDMTVVVEGNRITAVRRGLKPPAGARVVDGRGKYLVPGLWDMHVHMRASWDMRAPDDSARTFYGPHFLASGITGVREMWGAAKPAGVRVAACGNMLDGPQPSLYGAIACATPDAGREAVRKVKRDGANFVKVYSLLSREVYLAIVDEAKKAGLPVAGHVPNGVSAAEASQAGQKSIEHLTGVAEDPALFAVFVKNGTWQCPTLTVLSAAANFGQLQEPRLSLLPAVIQRLWKIGGAGMDASESLAARRARFEQQLRIVGGMHRAGVRILAGTDTPNPYVFPGTSLHDELQLLVKAGLKPAEALRAPTLGAAEFLGRAEELGTIAPGKLADMVLLDRNPLADIANTRAIRAVMANGRLYDQGELDRLRATRSNLN